MADNANIEAKVKIDSSDAQGALAAMVAELKALREGWERSEEAIEDAENQVHDVDQEQKNLNRSTSIWTGIWQGVGQALFGAAMRGLKGLYNVIADNIDAAGEFGDTFDLMAARGVQNVGALKEEVRALANELGASKLDVAKGVSLISMIGPNGTDSIEATNAAMFAARLTGADFNNVLRESAQLTKAFGLSGNELPNIIAKMVAGARAAKVEFDEFAPAMIRIGPTASRLGISIDKLTNVSIAGLRKGLQPTRMGLQGWQEVMEQLAAPTDEFLQALQDAGIIADATFGSMRQSLTQNFDAFITKIGQSQQVMGLFGTESQTFLQGVSTELGNVATSANSAAVSFKTMQSENQQLVNNGFGAYEQFRKRITGLGEEIAAPFSAARDAFFNAMNEMFTEERIAVITEWLAGVTEGFSAWAVDLGGRIAGDIAAALDGERTFGDILYNWILDGLAAVMTMIYDAVKDFIVIPLMQGFEVWFDQYVIPFMDLMVDFVTKGMDAAKNYVLNNAASVFQPITDWMAGVGGDELYGPRMPAGFTPQGPSRIVGPGDFDPSAMTYRAPGAGGGNSYSRGGDTFIVQGGNDRELIAKTVQQVRSRDERLGRHALAGAF
jgi:TP901 family phage tail tape measure protein